MGDKIRAALIPKAVARNTEPWGKAAFWTSEQAEHYHSPNKQGNKK